MSSPDITGIVTSGVDMALDAGGTAGEPEFCYHNARNALKSLKLSCYRLRS